MRDVGAGAEDRANPRLPQKIVILGRDHAADHDQDVAGFLALQRFDQGRNQGLVPGRLAGDADDVNVVFDGLARGFLRGLEEGPISTSNPISANAVAMTLAPRSCPSWPNLATSMRGRRPSSREKAAISRCTRRNASSSWYWPP